MRHGKKFNHLGRKPAHRKATLSNMASSLILHKRITTTLAKAKALRKYVEPIITRSKDDTTHSRRMVFRYLQDKDSVKELFGEIAEKVASRPGGYTRIIRTPNRLGDNAEMCMMEFVDYNELLLEGTAEKAKTTRRSRRKKKADDTTETVSDAVVVEEAVVEEASEEKETGDAVAEEEVAQPEAVADTAEEPEANAENNEADDTDDKDSSEEEKK